MRISDWSSDVCSSDLDRPAPGGRLDGGRGRRPGDDAGGVPRPRGTAVAPLRDPPGLAGTQTVGPAGAVAGDHAGDLPRSAGGGEQCRAPFRLRTEGHTSELHSLMRISYAVVCLNKKKRR